MWRWRSLVVVATRLGIAAAGLALAFAGGTLAADAYDAMRGYQRAPQCASRPPGDQRECVATVTVTVVKRSTRVENDSPPTPFQGPPTPPPVPPQPFVPPVYRLVPDLADDLPALAVRAAAGKIHYEVTVRTPDGKRWTFEVGKGLYDQAKPGTTGRAQMWRGRVTLLTVGAESKRISLFPWFFILWLVAWAGVTLFLGALFYPIADVSGWALGGGFVVGAVAVYLLRDWPPAVVGVPALVSVVIAAWWALERPATRFPWET